MANYGLRVSEASVRHASLIASVESQAGVEQPKGAAGWTDRLQFEEMMGVTSTWVAMDSGFCAGYLSIGESVEVVVLPGYDDALLSPGELGSWNARSVLNAVALNGPQSRSPQQTISA